MPGVGYVEMAFAASSGGARARVPEARYARASSRREVRAAMYAGSERWRLPALEAPSSFASCFARLANIEGCADNIGREFSARMERPSSSSGRHNSEAASYSWPRPRLLEVPSLAEPRGRSAPGSPYVVPAGNYPRTSGRMLQYPSNAQNTGAMQLCKSLGTVLSRSRVFHMGRFFWEGAPSTGYSARAEACSWCRRTEAPSAGRVPAYTEQTAERPRTKKSAPVKANACSLRPLEELTYRRQGHGHHCRRRALMDSGLDSIGATELKLTLLFDHPSRSIADALSADHEEVFEPEFETAWRSREPTGTGATTTESQGQSTPAIASISGTLEILGTVATDAPLMSVGLIRSRRRVYERARRASTRNCRDAMFDHPTIDAMASFIAETAEAPVAAACKTRASSNDWVAAVATPPVLRTESSSRRDGSASRCLEAAMILLH